MNRENDSQGDTAQEGTGHGGAGLLDGEHGPGSHGGPSDDFLGNPVDSKGPAGGLRGPVPHGGSTLAGGSASILGQRGACGNPRAAAVLRAVGEFMARQKASPGRAKRRGRTGCRGPKTAVTAPEIAPLFKEPAFAASGVACSSPCRTTAGFEEQQGRGRGGRGGGAR
jgi:hypothetical protein